jgi:hypothetical protein
MKITDKIKNILEKQVVVSVSIMNLDDMEKGKLDVKEFSRLGKIDWTVSNNEIVLSLRKKQPDLLNDEMLVIPLAEDLEYEITPDDTGYEFHTLKMESKRTRILAGISFFGKLKTGQKRKEKIGLP